VATAPESLTGYDFLAAGGIHFGFSLTMPTAVVVKGDGVGGVTSRGHEGYRLPTGKTEEILGECPQAPAGCSRRESVMSRLRTGISVLMLRFH
jgi:hypothetical protein